MSFWDQFKPQQPPLSPEELAAPESVSMEVAPPAPAPAYAPIDEGLNIREAIAPLLQQRAMDYRADLIEVPEIDSRVQEARKAEFGSSLEKLRNDYKLAQDDARSRQMKAEMFAAVGNNIGNIVGGAQAMNTKASVTPVQSPKMTAPDMMDRVDKNHKMNYEGLLKQYKDLQDGQLSPKDILEAKKVNAFLKQGEAKINNNTDNSNKGNVGRAVTLINKAEEGDEMTTKQTDQVVGIDSTLDSLEKLEGMNEFSTGPVSGRLEKVKRYLGTAKGNKVAMASQLQMIKSNYGKAISGATIADAEMIRIEEQLPKETDSDEQFAAKLANFKDELTRSRVRVLDSFKRSGRNVKNFEKRVPNQELEHSAPPASSTVRIQGPSGQTVTVSAEAAKKYLAKPGYKKVNQHVRF